MSNIIPFPLHRKAVTKNPEDISERLIMLKLDTIEDIMDYMMPNILQSFNDVGMTVQDNKIDMLESVLSSIMNEHYGFEDELDTFTSCFLEFSKHEKEVANVAEERLQA